MSRIAIVNKDKCNPVNCGNHFCMRICPRNMLGEECIVKGPDSKPIIDEVLCTGCGICTHRCIFEAIRIINLPEALKENPVHRFGANAFELFHLPIPKKGKVVGIIGRNGIGKSTAFNILSGKVIPNLGNYNKEPSKEEIIAKYSTTQLGDYFRQLYANKIVVSYKPQRIELLPKVYSGKVGALLKKIDERKISEKLMKELELENLKDRELSQLSGGELQKVAIIAAASKKADVYYFDEPASFLDVTARIKVAKLIRDLAEDSAVLVVEHDLATIDYISDEIQIVYGQAGAYGVISNSQGVSRGINEYLDGFITSDNVRFRDYSIVFGKYNVEKRRHEILFELPEFEKSFGDFKLKTIKGEIIKGEVMTVMGANGLGKTTFLKLLAGEIKPDKGLVKEKIKIAYKVQYPTSDVEGTVQMWLLKSARELFNSGWYKQNILEKLGLNKLLDNEIKHLSGGELQKVYIAVTLSQDADIYAFDEPSAFIDVEDRLKVAEVIKEFIIKKDKAAIVVDHDVQFIDYISDSMLVFEGVPGKHGKVEGPLSKTDGMNKVLKMLDITYRVDKENNRPRINKHNSALDKTQKKENKYYRS